MCHSRRNHAITSRKTRLVLARQPIELQAAEFVAERLDPGIPHIPAPDRRCQLEISAFLPRPVEFPLLASTGRRDRMPQGAIPIDRLIRRDISAGAGRRDDGLMPRQIVLLLAPDRFGNALDEAVSHITRASWDSAPA